MFDLIALRAHQMEQDRRLAAVNRDGWRQPGGARPRPPRKRLAAGLYRLAARLDPTVLLARQDAAAPPAPTNA